MLKNHVFIRIRGLSTTFPRKRSLKNCKESDNISKLKLRKKELAFGARYFYVVQLAAVIILETPMYEPEPAINFVIVCVPNLMNIVKLIPSPPISKVYNY